MCAKSFVRAQAFLSTNVPFSSASIISRGKTVPTKVCNYDKVKHFYFQDEHYQNLKYFCGLKTDRKRGEPDRESISCRSPFRERRQG